MDTRPKSFPRTLQHYKLCSCGLLPAGRADSTLHTFNILFLCCTHGLKYDAYVRSAAGLSYHTFHSLPRMYHISWTAFSKYDTDAFKLEFAASSLGDTKFDENQLFVCSFSLFVLYSFSLSSVWLFSPMFCLSTAFSPFSLFIISYPHNGFSSFLGLPPLAPFLLRVFPFSCTSGTSILRIMTAVGV